MRRLLIVVASILFLVGLAGGIFRLRERQAVAQRIAEASKWHRQEDFAAAALNRTVSFDGDSLTVQQFADEISRQCKFPVIVDEAAITSDQPLPTRIEMPRGTYTMRAALQYLEIWPLDLCADFRDGQQM